MMQRTYIDGLDALPARFQLGDTVRVGLRHGLVTGVTFRAGKVFYEVGGVAHPSEAVTEPMKLISG